MFGGIVGNLVDRFRYGHVVDFIYFFTHAKEGSALAFNLADSAICVGVFGLFLISLQKDAQARKPCSSTPSATLSDDASWEAGMNTPC